MTELLYLNDSYLKECHATVTEVLDNGIILDKTIFYFHSGGQPNDLGIITRISDNKRFNILDVRKENGKVVHKLDSNGFQAGDKVHCQLDWDRRYALMRFHTATHLFSTVVYKEANVLVTGNQLNIDKTRIDFDLENCNRELIQQWIDKANLLIETDSKVSHYYLPREEAFKLPELFRLKNVLPKDLPVLRIVEIEKIDREADGGTHVKSLKEIGRLELISIDNKGKDNRRIYFKLV